MPPNRTAFRWATTALFAYCAVFLFLSVDLLILVWRLRDHFPRFADVAAVSFFELSRSAVTAGAVAIGLWLVWRRDREDALRPLAVAVGFATLAFTKAVAFRGFPGPVQEDAAEWLLARDVPRSLLSFFFGSPAWAVWPALAALLLFAARFPRPVTAAAIESSGRRDRAGMMAGARLAGLNVGTLFRQLARTLLEQRWLAPQPLAAAAVTAGAVHHALRHVTAANAIALLLAGCAVGVVLTLLRAAHAEGDDVARDRIGALRLGALAAAALSLAAAAAGLLPAPLDFLSAALLAVAPAPALYGVARAALPPRDQFVGSPPKIDSTSPVM